ncbi:hypothetical protein GGS23DRAFT_283191 [Durotheca rogersii]|uniref:uncharacterized protein n=1 Tax=Durotheca rogersii TaxID=419775 RepID=UPI00221F2B18|nr:uncharacterized protein GGS23DRAFT_283191 [Durotheca rogersii]KAI5866687.1 hypothetical protein GGS23DRAFT_283191 [Durotheca rogersii]
MGTIKSAFSHIPSLRLPGSSVVYQQLPSHDMSHASSPLDESPIMSDAWRKGFAVPRRRLGLLLRTSPRRLFGFTLAVFFTFVLFAGGSLRARRYYAEKTKVDERIPYHWEAYPRLNGFYNGIRSLVRYSEWIPEQQAAPKTKIEIHKTLPFDPIPVNPYPDFSSNEYLNDHHPVQRCYVDENEKYPAPDIFAYPGVPAGMTAPYWGSYESLGVAPDRCWERFGRLGPYGYSYPPAEGGLGLSNQSAHMGAEVVKEMFTKIDYRGVDWGKAQRMCFEKNRKRFEPEKAAGDNSTKKKMVKRSAYILRSWTGYKYSDIQLLSLRAMINELSLKSGGEYDVHLLVHVKDDTIPIWASEEVYNQTLRESVPEEFWGITTLWSEQQMRTYYPGPFRDEDNVENHSKSDIYGVYRTAHFALQWFAQQHQEYEFFWNWEMDIRYTGHYYELNNGISKWAAEQPRKYMWERSSRFWIPDIHGSWAKFSELVARETMKTKEEPIWGPVKFQTAPGTGEFGMLLSPNETTPPRKFEEDDYQWGVGEDADLITFDPIFDPAKTNWVFRNDVTGYNTSLPTPPRRAAIITVARLSRRLLNTMHEETFRMHHTMFPEMWPPTAALHHGYKAVYAPHPVYFDRKWPLDIMDKTFNYPPAAHDSPFGWGEHNMQGGSFYYNAGFSGALWRRWLGALENGEGGKKAEEAGSDRLCLRGILHHPIKSESVE